ncbi:MAG: HAMP domain-containing sensor histidine kinase [Synechococcaceae cyanobacterium]|nr:HAMP domain-containing sensor histidine kinase [Synechococcaceae cyanobacterium]
MLGSCCVGCWLISGAVLFGVLQVLLEPYLLNEQADQISRQLLLVEEAVKAGQRGRLPADLEVRPWAQQPAGSLPPGPLEARLMELVSPDHDLRSRLLRDSAPPLPLLGGHWIRLAFEQPPSKSPQTATTLWLHQPSPLAGSELFWSLLHPLSLLLGSLFGVALFLRRQVERPLALMIEQLPLQAASSIDLLPEEGIDPLRRLSLRINRLLEQINSHTEARRQLLEGLVHDLRGPLTRLLLQVDLLTEQPDLDPTLLAGMEHDLGALRDLSDQLAALSLESPPEDQLSTLSLDDLCRRIADSYGAGVVQVAMPRMIVRVNRSLLQRTLNNLIDNAIEYGEPPVRISVQVQDEAPLIQVEDHGSGLVSTDLLGQPPLRRADDRQRNQHRGLGLSIAEHFCRRHGGRLELQRSSLGGLSAELHLAHWCLISCSDRRRLTRGPWAQRG